MSCGDFGMAGLDDSAGRCVVSKQCSQFDWATPAKLLAGQYTQRLTPLPAHMTHTHAHTQTDQNAACINQCLHMELEAHFS